MKLAAAAAAAALLVGAAAPAPSLKVTYWPHGRSGPSTTWTLGCAPAVGTHPLRGRSCLALKAHAADLGAATRACNIAAIAGSPEAEIHGTYAGRTVDRGYRAGCPGWNDLRIVLTGS